MDVSHFPSRDGEPESLELIVPIPTRQPAPKFRHLTEVLPAEFRLTVDLLPGGGSRVRSHAVAWVWHADRGGGPDGEDPTLISVVMDDQGIHITEIKDLELDPPPSD